MMTRETDISRIATLLYLTSSVSVCIASGLYGGMRIINLEDAGKVRVVECYTDAPVTSVVGLSLYDERLPSANLVSLNFKTKECKTSSELASCQLKNGSSTASAKVAITDLADGETRAYGCNANYFETRPWTEIYAINLTLFRSMTTVSTNEQSTTSSASSASAEETSTVQKFTREDVEMRTLTYPEDDDAISTQVFGVTSLATGAAVSFVLVTSAVAIWMCRRRCELVIPCRRRKLQRNTAAQEHRDRQHMELPPIPREELIVNYQLPEDYNEVQLNGNAVCTRPLPRRPTSMESDYQEIPAPQAAPVVQSEGPYAGIKEDDIILEGAKESKEQKDSELGAATPDYVPIRDIAERKRRAKEGKAKRATVI